MKGKTAAYIIGILIFVTACAAETITMSPNGNRDYADDTASIAPIEQRLAVIEEKLDRIAYAQNVSHAEGETPVAENTFTDEEVMLMARVVQAEYGNGTELDKRLIVSVILNRLESDLPDFARLNTVEDVVRQPNQFVLSSQQAVTQETLDCVYMEIEERTDNRIFWFTSQGYLPYGNPIRHEGAHYFSGYENAN